MWSSWRNGENAVAQRDLIGVESVSKIPGCRTRCNEPLEVEAQSAPPRVPQVIKVVLIVGNREQSQKLTGNIVFPRREARRSPRSREIVNSSNFFPLPRKSPIYQGGEFVVVSRSR